jgi:hypothetical protein
MKLGTLVGVHGDRAVAVVRIWRGFASLEGRSSQKGEAVDDDCGMVVFQLFLIGPRPIGNVTDHVKRIALLDVNPSKTLDQMPYKRFAIGKTFYKATHGRVVGRLLREWGGKFAR